jgi:hypothetical protein
MILHPELNRLDKVFVVNRMILPRIRIPNNTHIYDKLLQYIVCVFFIASLSFLSINALTSSTSSYPAPLGFTKHALSSVSHDSRLYQSFPNQAGSFFL